MMKVFLWRPTWAHFHLELLWQFAIEDRIWVETLNYPACKERCPESTSQVDWLLLNQLWLTVLHKLQLNSIFTRFWMKSELQLCSSLSRFRKKLLSSVQILVRWAIDCGENQRVRSTLRRPEAEKDKRTKALFPWRKSADIVSQARVFFSFSFSLGIEQLKLNFDDCFDGVLILSFCAANYIKSVIFVCRLSEIYRFHCWFNCHCLIKLFYWSEVFCISNLSGSLNF